MISAKANSKYQRLRGRLIERGMNLKQFATQHGYPASTVYDAAKGARRGVESRRILKQLEAITNV